MQINHGRLDAGMPEQFLHRADSATILKQMSRERVAQHMRIGSFRYLRRFRPPRQMALVNPRQNMVPPLPNRTITRIVTQLPTGKEPEPFPTLRRIAKLLFPRKRLRLTWLYDKDIARSNGAIAFSNTPDCST